MKKILITAMAFMAVAIMSGCVSAKAYTKVKTPDGNVTESHSSVWGTGDKASQIAAEGMFADGTNEDLGAGFKSATATQESSGVVDTMMRLMVEEIRRQPAPVAAPAPVIQRSVGTMAIAPGDTCPTCGACNDCTPPSTQ